MPAANPPITAQAALALEVLGAQLRERRRGLKISATAAAEAAGMSRVTLHRIEKGEPSVTAGAYVAAALALGVRLDVAPDAALPAAPDRKGWIPARVRLDAYPKLKELAWQVHGTNELSPREALGIYERNGRHLEGATLAPDEQDLIEALRAGLGAADGV
jgi:transcriptional regulator with XRE-family HTH domain